MENISIEDQKPIIKKKSYMKLTRIWYDEVFLGYQLV
jgi:hypothetical protein